MRRPALVEWAEENLNLEPWQIAALEQAIELGPVAFTMPRNHGRSALEAMLGEPPLSRPANPTNRTVQ